MANDKGYLTFDEAVASLKSKFTSANSINVERATILRKEWEALLPILNEANSAPKEIYLNEHEVLERGHF